MSLIEVTEDFNTKYKTYIIAFSPDTDEFFVTNERYFYWKYEMEFKSEKEAIGYFITHIATFSKIHSKIKCHRTFRYWLSFHNMDNQIIYKEFKYDDNTF